MWLKVTKYSPLHISISSCIWQCFFCFKPEWTSKLFLYMDHFLTEKNTFVSFSFNSTFYLCSNLWNAQFSLLLFLLTLIITLVIIDLLCSNLQIIEWSLWEHKWLSKVTQVVIEVRTQTQVFWLQVWLKALLTTDHFTIVWDVITLQIVKGFQDFCRKWTEMQEHL